MARSVVLFDWRLTLFGEESYNEALAGSLASIGRPAPDHQLAAISASIEAAKRDPWVRAAAARSDSSRERHREFVMRIFKAAGLDEEFAEALYERQSLVTSNFPYPDAKPVLEQLKKHGCRVAVVSDIHFALQPHFAHYGLDRFVDAYALSFEHDFEKPEPKAFLTALEMLGAEPQDAVMVGDNHERDGGAAKVGILTLILPPGGGRGSARGLDAVLKLL